MKKLFLGLFFVLVSFTSFSQSMVLDTVYFYTPSEPFYPSRVWDITTYGVNDSLNVNGIMFYANTINAIDRYTAYSSGGVNVEVLAYGQGVTVTVANTNEVTVNIPSNVRLMSMKVRVSSLSSVKFFMGTNDMGNSSSLDRWMPLVQAWREDTGQQLIGLTCLMDITGEYDKFTVNGLINTTSCQIRIGF